MLEEEQLKKVFETVSKLDGKIGFNDILHILT